MPSKSRDDILRGEFGYNDAEIAAFNAEYPNGWVIEDHKYPNKWATDDQIENAQVESDGLIALVLVDSWIKAVQNFRDQKILAAVSSAVGAISDSNLQRRVSDDLDAILKLSGTERLKAFRDLISTVSGDLSTEKQVGEALSYLAAQGYQDNPFILIARARAALFGSQDTSVSTLLSAAVKTHSADLRREKIRFRVRTVGKRRISIRKRRGCSRKSAKTANFRSAIGFPNITG